MNGTTSSTLVPGGASGPAVAPARARVVSQPVSVRRAAASEWIKFRTLRSSWAVLALTVVGMLAIALVVASNTRHLTPNIQPDDLLPSSVLQGYFLAQMTIGALGVLIVSGEYGTGMIRSTFAAVPRRLPTFWAKGLVFTAVTAVIMTITSLVSFLAAQGLISHYRTGYSLGDPGAARAVFGTALFLTLLGLIGMAVGWLVRNTPGALVGYLAVVLVLPVLFEDMLGSWGKTVGEYLPSSAGQSFVVSTQQPHTLSPGAGLAVLVAWTVVALGCAAVALRRRDV